MKRKYEGDHHGGKRQKFSPGHNVRPVKKVSALPASLRGAKPEIKSVDFPVHANSPQVSGISSTATFDLLNGVQAGDEFFNRIGRKIMLRSIHVKGSLYTTGNVGAAGEYNRIMLVYDRQPNGAAPAIADLLQDYDNQGASTTNSNSSMNMNYAERFVILRDARIQIANSAVAAAPTDAVASIQNYEDQANINWFVPLNNLETHYKASSNPAVIGDIATGALFLVTYGNVASGSQGYTLNYTARLRYHDV